MTDGTNKSPQIRAKTTGQDPDGSTHRLFCVFYVQPATPKAIHTDTIMASDVDDATALAADKHKDSMILHVRPVGSDGAERSDDGIEPQGRNASHHRPILSHLPGARFINGEFLAATGSDDTDLSAISE